VARFLVVQEERLSRGGARMESTDRAVEVYQLHIWIRDSLQGGGILHLDAQEKEVA
jgi:hypothetical protein